MWKEPCLVLAASLLIVGPPARGSPGQSSPPGQSSGAQTQSNDALEFLGSYSAPSAISTTDTGHISAHPPSLPVARRLRQIEAGPTRLPPWRDDPASQSTAGRERDDLWTGAIRAWESGQLIEARDILTRLTSLEPDTAAVWFLLGGVALEEARASSRRLAQLDRVGAWNRRLESEALAFRYPILARSILPPQAKVDAKTDLSAAGEIGGQTAPSTALGAPPKAVGVTQQESRLLQAEHELRRLDSLTESPEMLYRRARAALGLSETAYSRAALSPLFRPYFYAIRALAAEEEGDDPAAESEYRMGLAEDPRSALLHGGLGHLLRRRLQLEPARAELALATSLDPTDPVATFELGDVDLRLGDSAGALPLLNRALAIDPELLLARWSRAKTYLALGDDRRALADLEAAAPADNSGELEWQLARLYRKMGRQDLAKEAEQRSEQQRRTMEEEKAAGSRQ